MLLITQIMAHMTITSEVIFPITSEIDKAIKNDR